MAKNNEEPRINDEIRVKEVLLIDDQGVKLGVVPVAQALALAAERELDLVEVSGQADPPVCRILDYGKYRFQQQKRDKDARKKTKGQVVKEMKMRPKIDLHDYNFKVRAVKDFLLSGFRVKVAVFFRGREMAFLDRGREVLDKVVRDCEGIGKVDTPPRMEGRYMRLMLTPVPQTQKKTKTAVDNGSEVQERTEPAAAEEN